MLDDRADEPWVIAAPSAGLGPVRCPACRREVADAPDGEHACGCGAREDGGKRGVDGLAAKADAARELAARWEATARAIKDEAAAVCAKWQVAKWDAENERDVARTEATTLRVLLDVALMALAEEQAENERLERERNEERANADRAQDELERVRFLSQEVEREFHLMNAADVSALIERLKRERDEARQTLTEAVPR